MIDGNPKTLIVVVIRGTQGDWDEWRSNFEVGSNLTHEGFNIAMRDLSGRFDNYILEHGLYVNPQNNIVLITGHSRGGAVANLKGANLNSGGHDIVLQENLYVYTFGAPNTTRDATRHLNIFNIINRNDAITLVPRTLNPFMGNEWQRHGRDLAVTMTRATLDSGLNLWLHHCYTTYWEWMRGNPNLTIEQFINLSREDTHKGFLPRLITIKCPVNVWVYNSQGRLVGEIINNVSREIYDSEILAWVTEYAKHFFLPYGDTYTIRFIATDSGIMTYLIESIDVLSEEPYITRIFEDVTLYTGRRMVSEIVDTPDVRLLIIENEVPVGEILTDGTEIRFGLTSLTIPNVTLSPAFCPSIFNYTASVANSVTSITINAVAIDGATVTGTGTHNLNVGQNIIIITVTTETGHTQTYTIVITRAGATGNGGGGAGTPQPPPQQQQPTEQEPDMQAPPPPPAPLPFADVATTAWYYNYVRTVWENNIFRGTADNQFSPQVSMTRAMFAQVLANLEDVDLSAYRNVTPTFNDVSATAWYFEAVEWAVRQGIVLGVGNDNFAPNAHITREQMAVMLYRYADVMGIEFEDSVTETFTDEASISYWAVDAVSVIQSAGIVVGRPDGRFDPQATATRAEVATIFARFLSIIE